MSIITSMIIGSILGDIAVEIVVKPLKKVVNGKKKETV